MRNIYYFANCNNRFYQVLKITLLMFLLTACGALPKKEESKKDPGQVYKKDMYVCVDGKCAEGALIVPRALTYKVKIKSKVNLDLFAFSSCHREVTSQEYSRGGFFGLGGNKEFEGDYVPVSSIESVFSCPVYLRGYSKSGYESTGFIDFETPEADLKATVYCNGVETKFNGVSVCQSKAGLIQTIKFSEPVTVGDAGPQCNIGKGKLTVWEFSQPTGECVHAFFSDSGKIHRFTTLGYTRINIGE